MLKFSAYPSPTPPQKKNSSDYAPDMKHFQRAYLRPSPSLIV